MSSERPDPSSRPSELPEIPEMPRIPEDEASTDTPPHEPRRGDVSCAEARKLLTRFLEAALPAREDRALRRHLPGCAECRERYTDVLAAAAGVGRSLKAERLERERVERRETQRRLAFGASTATPERRLLFLRPLLWSALIVFLMFRLTHELTGPGPLAVTIERGTATVAGQALGPVAPESDADRGDWCSTGRETRLILAAGAAELALESESDLMIESVEPFRVRLETGAAEVEGACTIVTLLGAVEVDGEARVGIEDGQLVVACRTGAARVSTPSEERTVAAGTTERFTPPWVAATLEPR